MASKSRGGGGRVGRAGGGGVSVGSSVTIPKGFRYGMGTNKNEFTAKVVSVSRLSDGTPVYRVSGVRANGAIRTYDLYPGQIIRSGNGFIAR